MVKMSRCFTKQEVQLANEKLLNLISHHENANQKKKKKDYLKKITVTSEERRRVRIRNRYMDWSKGLMMFNFLTKIPGYMVFTLFVKLCK